MLTGQDFTLSAPAISMRQSEEFGPSQTLGNAQRSTLSLLPKSFAIIGDRRMTSPQRSPLYRAMLNHTSKRGWIEFGHYLRKASRTYVNDFCEKVVLKKYMSLAGVAMEGSTAKAF